MEMGNAIAISSLNTFCLNILYNPFDPLRWSLTLVLYEDLVPHIQLFLLNQRKASVLHGQFACTQFVIDQAIHPRTSNACCVVTGMILKDILYINSVAKQHNFPIKYSLHNAIWLNSNLYFRYRIDNLITPHYWSC